MNNGDKIILDLCGGTGSWSKPYKEAGYDVRLITLPDNNVNEFMPPDGVYGILAAPPCTMFSFARTNAKKPRNIRDGLQVVYSCFRIICSCVSKIVYDTQKKSPLKFWSLENPRGMLEWFIGKPYFEFEPWHFGDPYKKRTQLWGYFNKPVQTHFEKPSCKKFDYLKTKEIHPEFYGKYDRQTRRAITPAGFAKAFFEANP